MTKQKWTSDCGRATLYCGDCLDVMPTLDSDSIDSVISDPPYGLKFMGKKWDHCVPSSEFWEATRRVMKPGAILLAFGGTRTFHRLTCAIEDAGLEIRDCLMWIYGSGFPKSHDISKAIDKAAGVEREKVRLRPRPVTCGTMNGSSDSRPWIEESRKVGYHEVDGPIPKTDAAKQWSGWGTALKSAFEPITLAMKPIDGTFAANALKHGVAGLNIDGSRIPLSDGAILGRRNKIGDNGWKNSSGGDSRAMSDPIAASGRWPANVILDEDAAAQLDAQSGDLHGAGNKIPSFCTKINPNRIFPKIGLGDVSKRIKNDSGGAHRFFYVAKACRSERNAGLDGRENHHPTCKPIKLLRYLCNLTRTPFGGIVLDPFMGSGSTGIAAIQEGRAFIGIEKEPAYFEITKRRIQYTLAESDADMFTNQEIG